MRRTVGMALVALAMMVRGAPAAAQEHPFQISLVTPIQIFPEEDEIRGVRLNILYGRNASVTGLDVGLINTTTREFLGLQVGIVGVSQGSFTGVQYNWLVNRLDGHLEGVQLGVVNSVEDGRGVQLSGVSHARNFRGLQIGWVNYAESIDGVQIGLVNIIKHGGQFPVMVLVNWGKSLTSP